MNVTKLEKFAKNKRKTGEIWHIVCPKCLSEIVRNIDLFARNLMSGIFMPEIFGNLCILIFQSANAYKKGH